MEQIGSAQIRPGRPGDLDGVLDVYNYHVLHTAATFEVISVSAEERRDWFKAHTRGGSHRLFVAATPSGYVLGWATTSPFRPRAAYSTTVESSVYCRPECQGVGIGTALYRQLFGSIQSEDIERIVAGIALPNSASVKLHERFGFRKVGTFTSVGRKFGRYWDVRWFERPRSL